jgi:hypothetical protein
MNDYLDMYITLHYILITNLPTHEYEKIMKKFDKEYSEVLKDRLIDEK